MKTAPSLLGTHLFLGMCVAGVTVFFLWAALGTIDIISLAVGEVIPASQVKTLQHLEGGIVREVRVREGDTVQAGQELITLEPVRNETEVQELQARITSLEIQAIRLQAEIATTSTGTSVLSIPETLRQKAPAETAEMHAYFETRRRRIQEQLAIQIDVNTQREQEQNEAKAQAQASRELLKHLREQAAISEQLMQKDLSNRMKHLEYLKDSARLQGVIAENEARQLRLQAALREGEKRLTAIHTTFIEEASKEQASVTGALKELVHRKNRLDDVLQRTVLRAPVSGVIKTVHVHTVGEVVLPGASILELVPNNDLLVIQAQLPIQEIGFVLAGQQATIRLDSPGSASFGKMTGIVTHVSPDSMVDKKGVPYYQVRIRSEHDHFTAKEGLKHPLLPGMRVQCAIVTGQHTILDYLLYPLFGSMDIALRER